MERHVQRCRPPGGQADRRPGQARHAAVQPAQHRPRQGGKYFRGCTKIFWLCAPGVDPGGRGRGRSAGRGRVLPRHVPDRPQAVRTRPPGLATPAPAAARYNCTRHVTTCCHVMSCHVVMFRAQAAPRAAPAPRGPAASAGVRPDQPQPEHRVLGQRGGGHGVLVRTCGGHRASCVTLQYIYTMHLTRPNRLFIYLPDNDLCIFILPLASSRIVLI